MKHLIILILLAISPASFSQQNDSVPKKPFEAFFGCECCQDTVMVRIPFQRKEMYECILYKSQYFIEVKNMGKIIWAKDIRTYLPNKKEKELCLFNGGLDDTGMERLIVSSGFKTLVVFYLKNGKQVKQSK